MNMLLCLYMTSVCATAHLLQVWLTVSTNALTCYTWQAGHCTSSITWTHSQKHYNHTCVTLTHVYIS